MHVDLGIVEAGRDRRQQSETVLTACDAHGVPRCGIVVEGHHDVDRDGGRAPATDCLLHASGQLARVRPLTARDDERIEDAAIGPRDERRGDDVQVGVGERPRQAGEKPRPVTAGDVDAPSIRLGFWTDGDADIATPREWFDETGLAGELDGVEGEQERGRRRFEPRSSQFVARIEHRERGPSDEPQPESTPRRAGRGATTRRR